MPTTALALDYAALTDAELVRRIVGRDAAAARFLITRSNQRLFRAAWSILSDRGEAEEAVQDGYLKAFAALPTLPRRGAAFHLAHPHRRQRGAGAAAQGRATSQTAGDAGGQFHRVRIARRSCEAPSLPKVRNRR